MLQIGVCEDEAATRMRLCAQLEGLLYQMGTEYKILEFSGGEGLLAYAQKHAGELDLVFLDIEMGELDGMETAKRLRAANTGLQIAFVTGYTDYVFDGYSVGALGYLLKPPKQSQLQELLVRALAALQTQEPKLFYCRAGEEYYRIHREDILYFTSQLRQIHCVTAARSYTFYGKLNEVEAQLEGEFIRIHQRFLVRAAAVQRVAGGCLYVGTQQLPISRAYQQAVQQALARWAL